MLPESKKATPGLFRRLAAAFYDAVLLIAVWFFATALLLPFNQGEAFTSDQYFYPVYILLVSMLFYVWFWTHGGQTLGLKSWKMAVVTRDGKAIGWRQAIVRFLCSLLSWFCFGLGILWSVFDKHHRCWHDYLSGTEVVMLE